jgi:hypothetical protein
MRAKVVGGKVAGSMGRDCGARSLDRSVRRHSDGQVRHWYIWRAAFRKTMNATVLRVPLPRHRAGCDRCRLSDRSERAQISTDQKMKEPAAAAGRP